MIRDHLEDYNPKSIDEVYEIVAKITNKDVNLVKTIVAHPFEYIRNKMYNLEEHSFYLHSFGTIRASLAGTNQHIRMWLMAYRQEKISRELCVNKITLLWKLRQKLIKDA